jgi:hypothetical protein
MKPILYSALALLTAACGAAVAERADAAPSQSSRLSCAIETTKTSAGIALRGIVRSSRPLHGDFNMTVTTSGAAGSSDIVQSGAYDTMNGPAILGEQELSLSRGQRLYASLEVRDASGRVCRDVYRR